MEQEGLLPHKLTLSDRKGLTLTGVTEVIRFDDTAVILKTGMGILNIHGQQLQLKSVSLEGGQAAVEGHVCALIYEEPRKSGGMRRLFG